MEKFKIRVRNTEESTLVQNLMFKLGYKWGDHNGLAFLDMPHLFFEQNMHIYYCHDTEFFEKDENRELTLDQLLDEIEDELRTKYRNAYEWF